MSWPAVEQEQACVIHLLGAHLLGQHALGREVHWYKMCASTIGRTPGERGLAEAA